MSYLLILFVVAKILFSFLTVAFFPGLAVSYTLFARGQLDSLERIFIAVLSSLMLSAVSAYVLLRLNSGIEASHFFLSIISLSALLILLAFWRGHFGLITRERLAIQYRELTAGSFRMLNLRECAQWLVALTIVLVTTGSFAVRQTANATGEQVEFFLAYESLDELRANHAAAGRSLKLPVTVKNHRALDRAPTSFRILVYIDGEFASERSFSLNSDSTWNGTVSISSEALRNADVVDLRLVSKPPLRIGAEPSLRLWLRPPQYGMESAATSSVR